jgi:hypothetical protein
VAETLRLGTSAKPLNVELADQGKALECPHAPGVYFQIAPWSQTNRRFRRALERRQIREALAARTQKDSGQVSDEEIVLRSIDGMREDPEFLTDAIILDVDGLLDGEGSPVEYTRARGLQILSDPQWRHIRDWVADEALIMASQLQNAVETDAKNSDSGSSGKKAGGARSAKTRSSKPTSTPAESSDLGTAAPG